MLYQKHEMEITEFNKKDVLVVCSYSDGGDTGWSYDSLKPDRSDS